MTPRAIAAMALVLAGMLVGCRARAPVRDRPVTVEAEGREFAWWFRYPGSDGVLGTADDVEAERLLLLPPNLDVTLRLKSRDYIYIMTLGPYDLREIAVPDLTYELRFRTPARDAFDLPVDPLCGYRLFHDTVMGRVVIEPRDDFGDWFGNTG